MGADDGAVNERQGPIDPSLAVGPSLQRLQKTLPESGLAPAIKPARDRADRTIAARQVIPRCAGAGDPENAIDDPAVIVVRPARAWLFRGQERLQPLPLYIGQSVTFHAEYMGTCSSIRQDFAEAP